MKRKQRIPMADKVVPREPTDAMQRAMIAAMFDEDRSDLKFREFCKIVRKGWRAGYDAAPAAPAEAPQGEPVILEVNRGRFCPHCNPCLHDDDCLRASEISKDAAP